MPVAHSKKMLREQEDHVLELLNTYSPELLYRYEMLKKHFKNHAVKVVNGVCGGCFITLTKSELIKLTHAKKIDVCENCGRLIYIA